MRSVENTEPGLGPIVQVTRRYKITKTLTVNLRGCHYDVSPIAHSSYVQRRNNPS